MGIWLRTKELREERGLSQMDLGLELGLGHASIQQYEAGVYEPSFENLIKIAEFFGVSTDYLLGRTPIREPLHTNDEKLAYQLNHLRNSRVKRALVEILSEVYEYDKKETDKS